MKNLLTVLFISISSVLMAQQNYKISDSVANEGWSNNASEVLKQASESNSMVIFNFTGSDWCKWCFKIKEEIFDTDEFKAWAKKNNVKLLEIDFPKHKNQSQELKNQNNSLKSKFAIRGFPTIIVVKDGKSIRTGYIQGGPTVWIKNLEDQLMSN